MAERVLAPGRSGAVLRVVACGSVDDGKSTLLGRLLVQTGSVPDDVVEAARRTRRGGSAVPAGEVDYSLVTDGLEAEREQGITIDVAYRQLVLPHGRRVVLADAPGHEQYTRNMAVAASTADLAVLLVDATRGVRAQTHRHLSVCGAMGVGTVVVAVNKLDAAGFDRALFEALAAEVRTTAARLGLPEPLAVPVSALDGDNVVDRSGRCPWYDGPTVLGALEAWRPAGSPAGAAPAASGGAGPGGPPPDAPLRFPVQLVVRAEGFRGYAGTVVSGRVRPGDPVAVAGRGAAATVARVATFDGDLAEAGEGAAAVLVLADDLDVSRGDLLADPRSCPAPADRFAADLVWVGEAPLAQGRSYLLVAGQRTVPATVTRVRHRLDVVTGAEDAARSLGPSDIGRVELATDAPVPMDPYALCRDTGGFLLVDRVTADTVAAGMVRAVLRRSFTLVPHAFAVDRAARERLAGHRGRVVWLTGLPGSGKSTAADAAERGLHARGVRTYVLDGDGVRRGLTKDLGFTASDRAENVRRVAEAARLLLDAGVVVLVALVSPVEADRRAARESFAPGDFLEVFVDTPVEVCAARDPKGLYARAAAGDLPNLTGVGQAYETPPEPDLVLDGAGDLAASVRVLVDRVLDGLEVSGGAGGGAGGAGTGG